MQQLVATHILHIYFVYTISLVSILISENVNEKKNTIIPVFVIKDDFFPFLPTIPLKK